MVDEIFEIFIAPTGHVRCRGCDEIVFQTTDESGLVMPEESVSDIDKDRLPENFDRLPENFDLGALPAGFCPWCENTQNLDIGAYYALGTNT